MITACTNWRERIIAGESLIPPPLYPTEADAALDIFKMLRVADMAYCPTMGEVCRPWIFDFVRSVFGAFNEQTARREQSEWFLSVSKKNFKSGLAAGIMMTALIRNWRDEAEYGIIAPTVEIANNSFGPASAMIRADEELSDLFLVQSHIRTITHRTSKATLKVVAAEGDTVGGKKFTGVLFDELWLFGKRPKASDMMIEATGGLTSRPEGFVISLTTMSNEAPAGVFRDKLLYARGVRDGRIKDHKFVPVLYEFPEKMIESKQHFDSKNWYITNPNMGASVDEERLQDLYRQAREKGDEEIAGFFAKHLNVEIGLALASDRWAGADFWQQCAGVLTLEELIERSDVIEVGIDGGGLDDLLGFSVVGRDPATEKWLLWNKAWAHPSVLERRKSEAPRFKDFSKQGDLSLVGAIGDDVVEVADICAMLEESGKLDRIGVDPVGLGGILDAIEAAGVPRTGIDADGKEYDKIVGISQGWKLNGAIKTTERRLAEGKIVHQGSPMMAWCVGNAKVEPRGNAIIITKQASGSAKIDPLLATFNAISLMALNPPPAGSSFWERKSTTSVA